MKRMTHLSKIGRRVLVLTAMALPALVACGSDGSEDAAPSDTRTVAHAMGETRVPVDPQRVVVLDSSFLDAAVALDVIPVAATEASDGVGVPDYLAADLPDVEIVGLTDSPNLEAIAAQRPDLILGAKVRHEALYGELTGIAPTVFSESSGTNWKDGFAVTAEALGLADEGARVLADYESRAETIGTDVGAEGSTASIVRFLTDQIRFYGPETFSGTVLGDVGFDLGQRDWDQYSMFIVSLEQLHQADAEVVFATVPGGTETDQFTRLFAPVEPIWQTVPAVADGRQHWVDDDTWMIGIGPTGAGLILDDVESLLAGP